MAKAKLCARAARAKEKTMLPRFTSDYRTLFWALVLFPALPAAAYASPSSLPWLAPGMLYLSYCAGVLTHNYTHAPVLRARWANDAYGVWLTIFYGCPVAFWIPTHLENHHRFLDSAEDVTRTRRRSVKHDLYQALAYCLSCAHWQRPLVQSYVRRAFARGGRRWATLRNQCVALVLAHTGLLSLALWLHGTSRGLLVYAAAFGAPALVAPLLMFFTNYIQHVHCDPASAHDHSRNFVSRWVNWLVFDAGYHTVHHERPSLHWSRYAALHRSRAASIHPRLQQTSVLRFCLESYLLGAVSARYRTPPLAAALTPACPSPGPRAETAVASMS
jgi:fatty acid desaturase